MDAKALEKTIRRLLAETWPDEALRTKLEHLAETEDNFPAFTWLWGPALYARNRLLFRPLILSRFGQMLRVAKYRWKPVEWKGEVADALQPWLEEVDRLDDVELFRRLYGWRLGSLSGGLVRDKRQQAIQPDLLSRFRGAATRAARETVLQKFSLWFELSEDAALALHEVDSAAAGPFILRHLPWSWLENKRPYWTRLLKAAAGKNEKLRWQLYRRQVPRELWEKDVLALGAGTADAAELCRLLEQHHPEGFGRSLGSGFLQLLKARGRDVFPYVARHLGSVRHGLFTPGHYGELLTLARQRQWWDLWAAVVRSCANPKEFNREVALLLEDKALPAEETRRRLAGLSGVSREFNFAGFSLAAIHQLDDSNACLMLRRFPELLRGPYLAQLQLGPWSGSYTRFVEKLIAGGEDDLLDHIAARLATRRTNRWLARSKDLLAEANRLADHYQALKADEAVFSRRAASVLGRIPAFAISQYGALIRENRLARLLFERSAVAYLADARSLCDLVEGAEIHVQALAYRALGLDDPRARRLAAENLPLLLGTLLRPLHRATRRLAFAALANAGHDLDAAGRILAKAREALDLPDEHYPKEDLLGLIATLLKRWPQLQGPLEKPVVHGGNAA